MIVIIETRIGFKVSDDYEQEQKFKESNDMGKWRKEQTSLYTWYTNTETTVVERGK